MGTGDAGELGLGSSMLERMKPMPLKTLQDLPICNIICGGMHTMALTKDGKLYSWGCNDEGALGRSGDEYEPALVENLEDVFITKVACGDSITLALSDKGKLYCWGTFRCAQGALGFSPSKERQTLPSIYPYLANDTFVDIAAGTDHCLALSQKGRVYVWGNGQQYQLGRRVLERRQRNGLIPETLGLRKIRAIGCGSYHSFAIDTSNRLYVWGLNNYGQCGLDRSEEIIPTPTIIDSLQDKGQIKSVAGGEHHSVVLMESGHVYAFGRADSSQLGLPKDVLTELSHQNGQSESAFKMAVGVPTLIPGLDKVAVVACGGFHGVAATVDGTAYAWGYGSQNELGNGTGEDEQVPIKVSGQKLEGHMVKQVAAGGHFTVLLGAKQ
ncbi:regulator of chromosome condensation 1/beta-lactamase-inhibitor protein II [Spinellus fusiger]|nr:regulator of chromosome condensation 1/beta-lactamase-inhibitor protein II [Spinellus fusiger]